MILSSRPLVAVLWDDAHAMATGEFTQEEVDATRAYQFTTYGLLARDDDEIVAVASEEGEDGKLRGITFIPRRMVVEMKELGVPRSRGRRRSAAPPPSVRPSPEEAQTSDPSR